MSSEALVLSESEVRALIPSSADDLAGPVVAANCGTKESKFIGVPYVGFRGLKSVKHGEALDAAGIDKLSFYLHDVAPVRVKPFGVHVLNVARFYTTIDRDMQPDRVLLQSDDSAFDAGYREYLIGSVLVAIPQASGPSAFIPAAFNVRSGMTAAFRDTMRFLEGGPATDATKWSARGPAYAASAGLKWPGLRFRTEIWGTSEDGGDNDYNQGHGRVYPTPEKDIAALQAFMTDQKEFLRVAAVVGLTKVRIEKLKAAANS